MRKILLLLLVCTVASCMECFAQRGMKVWINGEYEFVDITNADSVTFVEYSLTDIPPAIYGWVNVGTTQPKDDTVVDLILENMEQASTKEAKIVELHYTMNRITKYKTVSDANIKGYVVHFFLLPAISKYEYMKIQDVSFGSPHDFSGLYGVCNGTEVTYNGVKYILYAQGVGYGGNVLLEFCASKKK